MDHGGEFMTEITNMKSLTLFAPSNAAWENANLNNILQTKDKVKDILRMHLVADKLPLEKILSDNIIQVTFNFVFKNIKIKSALSILENLPINFLRRFTN